MWAPAMVNVCKLSGAMIFKVGSWASFPVIYVVLQKSRVMECNGSQILYTRWHCGCRGKLNWFFCYLNLMQRLGSWANNTVINPLVWSVGGCIEYTFNYIAVQFFFWFGLLRLVHRVVYVPSCRKLPMAQFYNSCRPLLPHAWFLSWNEGTRQWCIWCNDEQQ